MIALAPKMAVLTERKERSEMERFYHQAPAKVTKCYECGETTTCEVVISDPEPETGYVDEYALCEGCKNGKARS